MRSINLSIIATHPIQYQTPWFRSLAENENINLRVFYAMIPDQFQQGMGFGVPFSWDVPLLDGYSYEVLVNKAKRPCLSNFWGTSTPDIERVLRKNSPDAAIITGWNSFSLLQALWACLHLNIPTIVRGESNALKSRPLYARVTHRLLLSCYNGFLAIGRSNFQFYLRNGVPQNQIFSCPYFVDNQRILQAQKITSSQKAEIRNQWHIPSEAFCFLFVGKLIPKKRIFDLLQALALARKINSKLHLLVVGSGELLEKAREISAESNLSVTFTGFLNQSQIIRAYVAADCLVLPSDYGETWGLVVNEAMLCGLPAIVSDRVGCGPDLIDEGVTGAIFPFGNVEALSQKLVEFASDPERTSAMGKHAQHKIQSYSVEIAQQGTLHAIEWVINRYRP